MKVEINNLIFHFNNIKIKKLYIENIEKKYVTFINNSVSYFSTKEICYDDFINILKTTQNIYIFENSFANSFELLEELFNYFKIHFRQ